MHNPIPSYTPRGDRLLNRKFGGWFCGILLGLTLLFGCTHQRQMVCSLPIELLTHEQIVDRAAALGINRPSLLASKAFDKGVKEAIGDSYILSLLGVEYYGFYNLKNKQISIKEGSSSQIHYHEITHAFRYPALPSSDFNPDESIPFAVYCREECIADTASYILAVMSNQPSRLYYGAGPGEYCRHQDPDKILSDSMSVAYQVTKVKPPVCRMITP